MNIQDEKLEIIKLVLETENSDVLESIRILFKMVSETDLMESVPQDQQEEIMEFENDETEDFDEFIKKYGQ
ncbi:MAG TPA: hypothetical protein DCL77_01945 [Prolixibacteraceae bacterium]|jgi:hypothetical protein|nr:hypothetical protein [Prolixibacteraceae bacterium]